MIDNLKKLTGKERLGQNRESEYLGAEDIDEGAEPILTIDAIWNGMVTLQRGKENKDVISFREKSVPGIRMVRPLIINATNRKTLRKLFKSVTADALTGQRIQLYIDHKVRDPSDGSMTDGVRIKSKLPPAPVTIKCEKCGQNITPAYGMSPEQFAEYTKKNCKMALCAKCAKQVAEEREAAAAQDKPEEPAAEVSNDTDT